MIRYHAEWWSGKVINSIGLVSYFESVAHIFVEHMVLYFLNQKMDLSFDSATKLL